MGIDTALVGRWHVWKVPRVMRRHVCNLLIFSLMLAYQLLEVIDSLISGFDLMSRKAAAASSPLIEVDAI